MKMKWEMCRTSGNPMASADHEPAAHSRNNPVNILLRYIYADEPGIILTGEI